MNIYFALFTSDTNSAPDTQMGVGPVREKPISSKL